MTGYAFSAEEIAKCNAAMSKHAPMTALSLIASGRLIVELTRDGRNVLLDSVDGRKVRDGSPDRKTFLGGAWPLFRAGMIDQYGVVTEAGRRALDRSNGGGDA